MQKQKQKYLWKYLAREPPHQQFTLKLRRSQTDGNPHDKYKQQQVDNQQNCQINSPTFHRSHSLPHSCVIGQSEGFSFGDDIVQEIQNMFIQSNHQQINQQIKYCQSNQKSKNIKKQNIIKKFSLHRFYQFVNSIKIIINSIKINIKAYQSDFIQYKNHYTNSYINMIINKKHEQNNNKITELQQKIQKLQYQNKILYQKYKILQKKNIIYHQQIQSLNHFIVTLKSNYQQLSNKYLLLNTKYHQKISDNFHLLTTNCTLKQSIIKIQQNHSLNNTSKTNHLDLPSISIQGVNSSRTEKCSLTQELQINQCKNISHQLITPRLTNTSNTISDYYQECTESIACSQQNCNILKKDENSNKQILKQNQHVYLQKYQNNQSIQNKKRLQKADQKQKNKKKSITLPNRTFYTLNKYPDKNYNNNNNNNTLFNRLVKLKNNINDQIISIKKQRC